MVSHVEASNRVTPNLKKITQIRKRDGRILPFNKEKITNAIYKAIVASGSRDRGTRRLTIDSCS